MGWVSPIITLHILYNSLVHRLYEGRHIWRKVKNRNISQLQFKLTRVCVAIIKWQHEFGVFRHANLAEIFFHRGNENVENPILKDLPVNPGIWLPCVFQRSMQNFFKCSWTLVLTNHPHLAPRLKKERDITLLPFWAFIACSGANFTFVNLPVNPDFRII